MYVVCCWWFFDFVFLGLGWVCLNWVFRLWLVDLLLCDLVVCFCSIMGFIVGLLFNVSACVVGLGYALFRLGCFV